MRRQGLIRGQEVPPEIARIESMIVADNIGGVLAEDKQASCEMLVSKKSVLDMARSGPIRVYTYRFGRVTGYDSAGIANTLIVEIKETRGSKGKKEIGPITFNGTEDELRAVGLFLTTQKEKSAKPR